MSVSHCRVQQHAQVKSRAPEGLSEHGMENGRVHCIAKKLRQGFSSYDG